MSNILVTIVGLVILWVLVSIPVYISGKIITGRTTSFLSAMAATLGGPLVYGIVLFASTFFLGVFLGGSALVLGLILAFIAWLAVYRAAFQTGWLGALAIAVLALVLFIVINAVLGAVFGAFSPDLFPYQFRSA